MHHPRKKLDLSQAQDEKQQDIVVKPVITGFKDQKVETASSKIFGGDRSRIRKIVELRETLELLKIPKVLLWGSMRGSRKKNKKNELERFEKERHDYFLGMLRGFIVYLGMPIEPAVTELLVTQFMWLEYDSPSKSVCQYI